MKQLNENIKSILAIMIVTLAFTYFFATSFFDFDVDPQIIIAIVGMVSAVISYFFGSSASGAKKDETITTMAKNITPIELALPEEPIKVDVTKDKK